MGFNYGYKLNDNPKLASLREIRFEPITGEHEAIVNREIKRYRIRRRRGVIHSIIFLIIGLVFTAADVWVGINLINARLLAIFPAMIALMFITVAVVNFVSGFFISVYAIREGVVADRETHEYYIDDVYGNPKLTSADHVTVRFPEEDKDVSLGCDAYTQMHCIPGKKVYVLKTNRGIIISFDDD